MKAPAFWYQPPGWAAGALQPLAWVYDRAGRWRRSRAKPWQAGIPVLCVGNLVAGGQGKTPVALALADALRRLALQRGQAAPALHFLTRGYGGRLARRGNGPVAVEPGVDDAAAVGDEALLLAASAPTWVSPDRAAGARAAVAAGARLIIMDDGLQNPGLHQDAALVVVDGASGWGNGRVIPAGPLREPVAAGLARASAVVLVGQDRTGIGAALAGRLPVLSARLEPDPLVAARLRGRRLLAFAGIGRPAKFFDTCRALGAEVVEARAFADHHPYRPNQIMAIVERAAALKALPVTTAKDALRLPPPARAMIEVLPVSLRWAEPERLASLLTSWLSLADRPGGS